jgi:EVE domain/HNH endonuclease
LICGRWTRFGGAGSESKFSNWALTVNAEKYDIEGALKSLQFETWRVDKSHIKRGDWAIIWRGFADSDRRRGVIAFAEVLSDPEMRPYPGSSFSRRAGTAGDAQNRKARIDIRFVLTQKLPIWERHETENLFKGLTVKGHQGFAFRVTPDQWRRIASVAELEIDSLGQPDVSQRERDPSVIDELAQLLDPENFEDLRKRSYANSYQREGQGRFRDEILVAYGGKCAITGCRVERALEAAHIIGYLGPHTNIVRNGLLLRRDIHGLFDAKLMSIHPGTGTVAIAPALLGTEYEQFGGQSLNIPVDPSLRPGQNWLYVHWRAFERNATQSDKG